MRSKREPRAAATDNGARRTKDIITARRLKNKIHLALMRGSFAGGVIAMTVGFLRMETVILEGAVISLTGIAWCLAFYILNPGDRIFDGGADDE